MKKILLLVLLSALAATVGSCGKEDPVPATPEKPEEKPEEPAAVNQDGTVYAIQVLVTSKEMDHKDPFFKGLEFKRYPAGKYFKYVIGDSSDISQAREFFNSHKTDFPDAFLVRIENGTFTRIQ